MFDNKCAFCGDENLTVTYKKALYDFVEGIPIRVEIPIYNCPTCKEAYGRFKITG